MGENQQLDQLPGWFSKKDEKELDLISRIKSGDKAAFTVLYNKYWSPIKYYCYQRVRDNQISEDLATEILTKVYEKIKSYEAQYTFNSWVIRITKNHVIDHVRKSKRNPVNSNLNYSIQNSITSESGDLTISSVLGCDTMENDSLNPEQTFTQKETIKERRKFLAQYIMHLKERDRKILKLYYVDEMSYDEISKELDLNLNCMKVSLKRAKDKLKSMIGSFDRIIDLVTE